MTAQEQEEIWIVLERVVDRLSLGAEGGIITAIDHVMSDHNRTAIAVGLEQAICPCQHRCIGARIVLQVNHDEVQAAGAE